jgi:hypothetical protein
VEAVLGPEAASLAALAALVVVVAARVFLRQASLPVAQPRLLDRRQALPRQY